VRVLLQKVVRASVNVDGTIVGAINRGYLLFVGVLLGATETEATWLAEKIVKLRLFPGDDGPPRPNGSVRAGTINPTSPRSAGLRRAGDRSLLDVGGEALVVSQFTLAGRTEKGNRPDYTAAAPPEEAKKLYEFFVEELRRLGVAKVETGKFGAMMAVELVNDGPVTLWLEK